MCQGLWKPYTESFVIEPLWGFEIAEQCRFKPNSYIFPEKNRNEDIARPVHFFKRVLALLRHWFNPMYEDSDHMYVLLMVSRTTSGLEDESPTIDIFNSASTYTDPKTVQTPLNIIKGCVFHNTIKYLVKTLTYMTSLSTVFTELTHRIATEESENGEREKGKFLHTEKALDNILGYIISIYNRRDVLHQKTSNDVDLTMIDNRNYREVDDQNNENNLYIAEDDQGPVEKDEVTRMKTTKSRKHGNLGEKSEKVMNEEIPSKRDENDSHIRFGEEGFGEEQADLLMLMKDKQTYSEKSVEGIKQSNTDTTEGVERKEDACNNETTGTQVRNENTIDETLFDKSTHVVKEDGSSESFPHMTHKHVLRTSKSEEEYTMTKEEEDQQKLYSSSVTEPDEIAAVKAYINEISEPQNNPPIESSEKSDGKMNPLHSAVIPEDDHAYEENVTKQVLSMIHIKGTHDPITAYMLPANPGSHPGAIGDTPWSWMRDEKWRISSFFHYPCTASKLPTGLAANGFVYIGSGKDGDDKVMCYFCNLIKSDWQKKDVIADIHAQLSPNCPMVRVTYSPPSVPSESLEHVTHPQPTQAASGAQPPKDGASLTTPQPPTAFTSNALERPAENGHQTLVTTTCNTSGATETAHILTSATTTPREIITRPIPGYESRGAESFVPRTNPSSSLGTEQSDSSASTTLSTAHTGQTPTPLQQTNDSSTPQSSATVDRLSYNDLGIVVDRPKRQDYASKEVRLRTFNAWPANHPISIEELADAGFYYAGYSDCARCFFCGGGMRNWEEDDDVWVEHARWFPTCGLVKQTYGIDFINAVRDLNRDHDKISMEDVSNKMGRRLVRFQEDSVDDDLKKDPAVRTVVSMGYREDDVIETARCLKDNDIQLSADVLFEKLKQDGRHGGQFLTFGSDQSPSNVEDGASCETALRNVKERNSQLRQQMICKVCLDRDVSIIFLPCGHLVTCPVCAAALKNCPVCRVFIKGTVKASLV